MSPIRDKRQSTLAAILKSSGLRSQTGLRAMNSLLDAGAFVVVTEAVAEVMLSNGIQCGRIPANSGMKTRELCSAAEEAIQHEVKVYHEEGNPLTSRFISPLGLVAEMAKQWLEGFSLPIPETKSLRGTLSDPEVQDRLTVAALSLQDHFVTQGLLDASGALSVPAEKLEGVCRAACLAVFRAFEEPNATNHRLIHKENKLC